MYEIKVHGFMLWASMGVLMPIGIISIRLMSIKGQPLICFRRLFFLHVTSQAGFTSSFFAPFYNISILIQQLNHKNVENIVCSENEIQWSV